MHKLFMALFVCLSLLTISCSVKQAPADTLNNDTLLVEIVHGQDQLQKGVPSKVTLNLINNSSDLLIIRGFDVKGSLPDIRRWYGSQYGSTYYRPLEDIWEYSPMSQTLSKAVFVTSLIAPGGKIEVEAVAVPKDEQIEIEVFFHKLPKDQVNKHLYLTTKDSDHFRNQYKHPEISEDLLTTSSPYDLSMAIAPDIGKLPIYSQKTSLKVKLNDPPIKLMETYNGEMVTDYVIWEKQNALIIETAKGIYFIKDNKTTELGQIDMDIFSIITLTHEKVGFILPLTGYEEFNPNPPSIKGPGYFSPGITGILQDDILDLFKFAKKKQDAISLATYDPTGLGTMFHIVVGDFNPQQRRDYIKNKNTQN